MGASCFFFLRALMTVELTQDLFDQCSGIYDITRANGARPLPLEKGVENAENLEGHDLDQ